MTRKLALVSSPSEVNRSRQRLQWTFGLFAAIPAISAAAEVIRGPRAVPGGSGDVAPTVDSAYRYANVFKFAVGPVIWSQLSHIERSPALVFAGVTIFAGGVARLWSWRERGRPHSAIVGATAVEVGAMPILLAWHRRVASDSS